MTLLIKNLSKTYSNGVKALININLSIPNGIFGLLGPNGAGKSSLMHTISTLQEPEYGSIYFNDIDVVNQKKQVRQILGYLPQEFGIYPKINAETLLNHLAVLKGITNSKQRKDTVAFLLEKTKLTAHKTKNLGGFSVGMKQRFGIAQALLGNPELLILDEPSAGLDPDERSLFYNLLSDFSEDRVVIISTQIVEDVKVLCKKMAIINKGQVIFEGSTLKAINDIKDCIYEARPKNKDVEIEFIKNGFNVISEKMNMGDPVLHIYSENKLSQFKQIPADLEDVYFKFIQSPN